MILIVLAILVIFILSATGQFMMDRAPGLAYHTTQVNSDRPVLRHPKSPVSLRVDATLRWALAPSNVILVAGKKRTGKSHILAWVMWYASRFLGYEVLTNMVFKQRQPDGKFKKAYPPGVYFVNSLWDVMVHTARVISTGDRKILIVMDEMQNFISAYEWNQPLAKDFVLFMGIISKLRQTYMLATPDPVMFPRGIKDPNADVATCLFYKDVEHTYDFNWRAGTNYKVKEIMFIERHGCKKEVWRIGICPWARPEHTVRVGEYVYDHMVPGSRFTKGEIGGYEFNFRHVVEALEGRISEEIPEVLVNYVRRYSQLSQFLSPPEEEAEKEIVYPEITDNMPKAEKKKIERDIIIPYLATFSKLKASEVANKGLLYSDPHLYALWRKYKPEA